MSRTAGIEKTGTVSLSRIRLIRTAVAAVLGVIGAGVYVHFGSGIVEGPSYAALARMHLGGIHNAFRVLAIEHGRGSTIPESAYPGRAGEHLDFEALDLVASDFEDRYVVADEYWLAELDRATGAFRVEIRAETDGQRWTCSIDHDATYSGSVIDNPPLSPTQQMNREVMIQGVAGAVAFVFLVFCLPVRRKRFAPG